MKRVLCVLMGLALIAIAPAELVDDFESYELGNVRDVASDNWTAIDGTGQADIFDDGTGNQVLGFGWSGGWRGTYNDNITSIADGTTGTVFFYNVYANSESLNHSFGLSADEGSDIDWFDNFEVQIGITDNGTSDDGLVSLNVRNGNDNIAVEISSSTWYNVWAVIDQVNDTYDVYISTGEADLATATLVADDALFRNAVGGSIGDLTAIVGCGYYASGQQEMWIDNISIVPEPATIALLGIGMLVSRKRK